MLRVLLITRAILEPGTAVLMSMRILQHLAQMTDTNKVSDIHILYISLSDISMGVCVCLCVCMLFVNFSCYCHNY